MMQVLIQALYPCFLIVAFGLPFIAGWRQGEFGRAVGLGWMLLVFASLVGDVFTPIMAHHFLTRDAAMAIIPNTPSTAAALLTGAIPAMFFYYCGKWTHQIVRKIKSGSRQRVVSPRKD